MADRPTREDFRAELDAIYARIPAVTCKGLCADTCTRIDASELERQLVADRGIELPPRVRHQLHLKLIASGHVGQCPALGPLNNCTVYTDRPLICRSFGTWRTSACEHGCIADRFVEAAEVFELAAAVEDVSERWIKAGRP